MSHYHLQAYKVIQKYTGVYNEENSNWAFCILYFNCHLTMFVTMK